MAEETLPSPIWEGTCDEEGLPHGEGKMIYPGDEGEETEDDSHGDVYEGCMENGMKQGKGKYVWKSGCVFEGEYEQNVKCGPGVMTMVDGSKYKGMFAEDLFNGPGTYTYVNGDAYDGAWLNGRKHGQGCYYCKSQLCQYEGSWSEGEFVDGRVLMKDGSTYKGTFKESVADGPGEFSFPSNGLTQRGRFEEGRWKNCSSLETETQTDPQMIEPPES